MQGFELEGYERACDFTSSILRKAGIMAPPVPLDVLCEHLGIKIVEKNIAPRRAMACKKLRTIYVNPKDTLERRVRIAHEIGHLILPETYPEMSHDLFSWCLLSPHEWMVDFSNPLTAQLISREHHLPVLVAKKRLRLFEQCHEANTHPTTPKDETQHGTDPSQSC